MSVIETTSGWRYCKESFYYTMKHIGNARGTFNKKNSPPLEREGWVKRGNKLDERNKPDQAGTAGTCFRFQISLLYSVMVRSVENLPLFALFMMLIRVQPSRSRYA